ncbi:MAG: Ribosomal small subunit methyltransferase [Planctomycetota bacterium]
MTSAFALLLFPRLPMALRIISGKYRRRLLRTPSDDSTRPYTDRVRQMTFDRLAAFVPGARVADIFAGVGTMGMEALSRGAASCVFFEAGAEVFQLLSTNVRTIAPDARAICWRTDIRRTSFRPRGGEDCIPYSLIFFDPPYRIAEEVRARGTLAPCLKLLSRSTLSTPEAILVLRTPEHFEAPEVPGWLVHDCWELSSMMVWILVKPDAFVEDREQAAREAGDEDEFSMKNAAPEADDAEEFDEDGAEQQQSEA